MERPPVPELPAPARRALAGRFGRWRDTMTVCNWPSGREIRRLSWSAALDTLARMGADVDPLELEGRRLSDLRDLVHDLKRESHESGACACPAAAYIRAGGGTP